MFFVFTSEESRARTWPVKLMLATPVASAAVRSKVVVLLLFVVAPIVCGSVVFGTCFCYAVRCVLSIWFCNHPAGEEICHVVVIVFVSPIVSVLFKIMD